MKKTVFTVLSALCLLASPLVAQISLTIDKPNTPLVSGSLVIGGSVRNDIGSLSGVSYSVDAGALVAAQFTAPAAQGLSGFRERDTQYAQPRK